VVLIDKETGENLWSSTPLDLSAESDGVDILACNSEFDDKLAAYYKGTVSMGGNIQPNGKMCIAVSIEGDLDASNHIFSFVMTSTDDMAFDFWEKSEGGFVSPELEGFTKGDNLMSAGDWSSTASAVSVGAYANNVETRTYSGIVSENENMMNLMIMLNDGLGDIAPFSSFGEQSDGYCQPTVCAPGTNIVSSWNHYNCDAEILESMQWQGYPYGAGSGTSQATPAVSGIIACWLQAKSDMTINDIKTLLSQTSRTDDFVTSNPVKWGYGKIDAAAGIERILGQAVNIRTINDAPATHAIYDLQGRRVKQPVRGLYIQNGHVVVIK
jgi:subtilisin family serine protease